MYMVSYSSLGHGHNTPLAIRNNKRE